MWEFLVGSLMFLAVAAVIVIWGYQFIQLMLLSDSDFPGRHDKVLWFVAFILVYPLAPFVFIQWKQAYLSVRRQERNAQGSEGKSTRVAEK